MEFQACDDFVFSEMSANFSPSDCFATLLPYLCILVFNFDLVDYHYCLNPISFHSRSRDLAFVGACHHRQEGLRFFPR